MRSLPVSQIANEAIFSRELSLIGTAFIQYGAEVPRGIVSDPSLAWNALLGCYQSKIRQHNFSGMFVESYI